MVRSDPIVRRRFTRVDWILAAAIALLLTIIILPKLPPIELGERPLAELYNPVSDELVGVLMKIDKEHRFPNGTTTEGWLVRGVNGSDVWFPSDRFKKAVRVNR